MNLNEYTYFIDDNITLYSIEVKKLFHVLL